MKYDHGICMLCRGCGCCAEKERVIQDTEKFRDALLLACREMMGALKMAKNGNSWAAIREWSGEDLIASTRKILSDAGVSLE